MEMRERCVSIMLGGWFITDQPTELIKTDNVTLFMSKPSNTLSFQSYFILVLFLILPKHCAHCLGLSTKQMSVQKVHERVSSVQVLIKTNKIEVTNNLCHLVSYFLYCFYYILKYI